uniref:Glutamate rich 1 n=1 Tax=Scophthalmus maximus TaxID=52904 RepID=A0A8D3A669_SCOMX
MTHRKEVFQSKVLQRLYPAAPTSEKETSPTRIVEALAKKTYVKRKATQNDTAAGDAAPTQSAANPRARMYTVLPPPADYEKHSEGSVPLSQQESVNSAEDPAEDSVHESNEELDQDKEVREEQKRKRKRRKRKPTLHEASGRDGASAGESRTVAVAEGGEHMSRNKKRKLKKKRHKEKLLSMGVVPRAAALVFTYQKDGEEEEEEEEEEEDNERRAAEVSDFLRTTLEIYLSESKLHGDQLSLLSGTVDDLLSRISGGCAALSPVLKQLYSLKASVQQKEADKLEEALKELRGGSSMSAEETAAVVSLFQYWITDVLPMRADKTTEPSSTHPRDCQSQ